jgi:hypothetical protein
MEVFLQPWGNYMDEQSTHLPVTPLCEFLQNELAIEAMFPVIRPHQDFPIGSTTTTTEL